jgi:hypothetical protein
MWRVLLSVRCDSDVCYNVLKEKEVNFTWRRKHLSLPDFKLDQLY